MDASNSGPERSSPAPLIGSRAVLSLSSGSFEESRHILSECDRAVLLTIIYADLFDFPLTAGEVHARLIGTGFNQRDVAASLRTLHPRFVGVRGGFVFLRGRDDLVARRLGRHEHASDLWNTGRRYARWLSCIPFVRMVAVSGSLAVNNASEASDVDLFCVTAGRRLWLARLFIVPLSKLTRRLPGLFPYYLCANYVLSLDALEIEVEDQNLFTAHEVLQAVPLFGAEARTEFLERNAWVNHILPNLQAQSPRTAPPSRARRRAKFMLERALNGGLGDALNRAAYRFFVGFYRRRAIRRGWDWSGIAPAYQMERYTIPEGGYASVVADLFRTRVVSVAGGAVTAREIDALFPPGVRARATQYGWDRLFEVEYGNDVRGAA